MPTVGSYLLCGTPRTGSTLLCGLLRDMRVAGIPESYFRLPDEQFWATCWRLARNTVGSFDYSAYTRAAIAAGSTANGVFGARVMWGTIEHVVAKLSPAHPDLAGADLDLLYRVFGPVRFVHLQREDTVAQAVSWARAEQTQHWQDGDRPISGLRAPHFDAQQIRQCVQAIDEHNKAWRDWFTRFDIDPHPVRYEDLVADMRGTTEGILAFLGLRIPTGRTIAPSHRRQGDGLNDDWIARYQASQYRD